MRVSYLTLGCAVLLGGCQLPRPLLQSTYDRCPQVVSTAPPDDAVLFITMRQPLCFQDGVARNMTDLRSPAPLFAAYRQGVFSFYEPSPWFATLERQHGSKERPLVIFIHGFRTTNMEALDTAAHLHTVIKDDGPVLAVTWPSYGKFKDYLWDQTNAEWASSALASAALELGAKFPHIVIIAHSMGNHLALGAVGRLRDHGRGGHVDHLIMASPDVDRATLRQLLADGLGTPVTIYGSRKDQALTTSWRVHSYPRGGDLSWWVNGHDPDYTLAWLKGVEVVDTTDVDHSLIAHSAFLDTREGAEDLCRVVHGEGSTRPGIKQLDAPTNYYRLIGTSIADKCSM